MRKVILISVILLLIVLTQTNAMVLSQAEYAALQVLGPSAAPAFQAMFERARANPSEAPEYGVSGEINPLIEVGAISGALGAVDMTLADGTPGSMMLLVCSDATNPVTITPAHTEGFTKIFLNRAGDGVVLAFDGTYWYLVAKSGETSTTGGKSEVNTQNSDGDIDLTTDVTLLDASGAALAMDIADGYEGQTKQITLINATNPATITPAHKMGFTSLVLNRVGDGVTVTFDGTHWVLSAKYGLVTVTDAEDFTNTQVSSGAISLVTETTFLDANTGALAMTLADGYAGQRKKVVLIDDTNAATITPAHKSGFDKIVLTTAGDSADFLFDGTNWVLMSLNAYTSTAEITTAGLTAIPTNVGAVVLTSGGKHDLKLADGDYIGQKINIICIDILAGTLFLPVANFSSPSYITASLGWDTAMDSCILMWDGTYWQLIANNGVIVS